MLFKRVMLWAGLATLASPGWAQSGAVPPDAGRLLEQAVPGTPLARPPTAVLPPPASAPAAGGADTTPIQLHGVAFEGNTVFSADQLRLLMNGTAGRPATWGQLQQAVQRITLAYQARGYLVARALIPQQDLQAQQGVLRVQVLEGVLAGLKVGGEAGGAGGAREPLQPLVDAMLGAQGQQVGAALQREPLERALLLLGQRLGDEASVTLAPGPTLGSTDLAVALPPVGRRWRGQLALDNQGNRYSGEWRADAEAVLLSPSTWGDSLSLRTQWAQGLRYLSSQYQRPVGHDGLYLGANAAALRYTLCCQFAPLGAQGRAQTLGLTARYPLVLRPSAALSVDVALQHRRTRDDTSAGTAALKEARLIQLGLGFSHAGAMAGALWPQGLVQSGHWVWTHGRLDLGGVPAAQAADALSAQTHGSFNKSRLDYVAQADIDPRHQLQLRMAAQFAGHNLDSAEKFALGGATGIRAYPVGEAVGDSGWTLSLEARRALNPCVAGTCTGRWEAMAFVDAGRIRQHAQPWANALPVGRGNTYGLAGAGLGLSYSAPGWLASLTLAKAIGANPGADSNGNASDGRQRATRVWLQITRSL